MKFMLDTNTCIFLIKKKSPQIIEHLKNQSIGDVCISSITLAELCYGVAKSQRIQQNQHALDMFIHPLEIAFFDEKAAKSYGDIRAHLEKIGKSIGSMDMLIGAHALSLGVTLVTNNIREFKRIHGLKVIDWSV